MTRQIENPPALKVDAVLFPDGRVPPRGKLERRIVWNLLKHLAAAGFHPESVMSDEEVKTPTPEAVMEEVFNLDDSRIYFIGPTGGRGRSVLLICGNETDIVSDYSYATGDPDGFDAAMKAFDAEQFA